MYVKKKMYFHSRKVLSDRWVIYTLITGDFLRIREVVLKRNRDKAFANHGSDPREELWFLHLPVLV